MSKDTILCASLCIIYHTIPWCYLEKWMNMKRVLWKALMVCIDQFHICSVWLHDQWRLSHWAVLHLIKVLLSTSILWDATDFCNCYEMLQFSVTAMTYYNLLWDATIFLYLLWPTIIYYEMLQFSVSAMTCYDQNQVLLMYGLTHWCPRNTRVSQRRRKLNRQQGRKHHSMLMPLLNKAARKHNSGHFIQCMFLL